MTRGRKISIITILGFLAAVGPFSIDMYLPAFKSIAAELGTTTAAVGYSLTSYFIGISIGQLFYGPLTDRFGRKTPLLIGLGIYIVAAIAIILTRTLDWLIISRLVMALGGCAGIVVGRAMVRDLFPVKEMAQIFSTFILVIAISPMLAPTVGGFLSSGPGWRYIFVSLATFGTLMLLSVLFFLPESKKPDPGVSLKPLPILRQYLTVARNSHFLIYAIVSGLSFSALFGYIASAPSFLLDGFKLNQFWFGIVFAINAGGLIIGSQVNRLLLRRFSPARITTVTVISQLFIGSVFVILAIAGQLSLVPTTVLLFAFLFGTGIINPNATTLSIEPFTQHAGAASALLGAVQMAFGASASALMSAINGGLPALTVEAPASAVLAALLLAGGRKSLAASEMSGNSERNSQ